MKGTGRYMNPSRLTWRKSSHSTNNGECVEVAVAAPQVFVRDSKNPQSAHLKLDRGSWSQIRHLAKTGSLDLT